MENITEHSFDWEKDTWKIISSYFANDKILVRHQIESYNDFVGHKIQKIINEFNPIISYYDFNNIHGKYLTEYHVEFGDISISKPMINDNNNELKPMYPNDARLRNLTYSAALICDVKQKLIKYDPKTLEKDVIEIPDVKNVPIGKIPIMLQSNYCILTSETNKTRAEMGECEYDDGGYFIVNGSEKVIVCYEKKCENKIFVFPQSKGPSSTYSHIAEITSVDYHSPAYIKPLAVKLTAKEGHYFGRVIRLQVTKVKADIPIFVIYKALGFVSDRQIIESIVYETQSDLSKELINKLRPSIEESAPIKTQKIALEYISKYMTPVYGKHNQSIPHKLKYIYDSLISEILPHVGTSPVKKIYFLGLMIRKLLLNFMGHIKMDDRDSFINKRVESPGALLSTLFRANFYKLVKDLKLSMDKDIKNGRIEEITNNISKKIKSSQIETSMKYALATGNWGLKNQQTKKGVAQVMSRLSYLSSLSHRRRVIAPIERNGKQTAPRKLHNTQFGTICCCLTGDTTILCENNEIKFIKDLTEHDRVVSVNPTTLKFELTEIYNFFVTMPKELILMELDNGKSVKCTIDHPFLFLNIDKQIYELKILYDLNVHDKIVTFDYNSHEIEITKIKSLKNIDPELVYDFTTVSENHSFISNGIICGNCETPDGGSIGIVKNLALMAHITLDSDPEPLYRCMSELDVIPLEEANPSEISRYVYVFINGDWYGIHKTPEKLVSELISRRRQGKINIYSSISWDINNGEIKIEVDGGRLSRPLYIVKNNELIINKDIVNKITSHKFSWDNLLADLGDDNNKSVIEYIDTQESNTCMIAMTYEDLKKNNIQNKSFYRYTHCELHPSMMLGVLASNIPFPNHNQCIDENELVFMADGSRKKIGEIVIGDNVITFDPLTKKHSTTQIVHTYRNKTHKKIYEITTFSGRKIRATYDHKFMTNKGWKEIVNINTININIITNFATLDSLPLLAISTQVDNFDLKMEYDKMDENCEKLYGKKFSHQYFSKIVRYNESKSVLYVPLMSKVEIHNCVIADITTHSENQSFICGDGFCVHNSPRNLYQTAMGKQAIGIPATNFNKRLDTILHVLHYPQKPLVNTRPSIFVNSNELPGGQNAIVAIMCHTGYNQEDSLMFNQDSVNRGLFNSSSYKTYKDQEKKNQSTLEEEKFCKPEKFFPNGKIRTRGMKQGSYDKLDENGMIKVGSKVEPNDIIIGKVLPLKQSKQDDPKYKDVSVGLKENAAGTVDWVYPYKNDGYKEAKVRIRTEKIPEVGDKFACLKDCEVLTSKGWKHISRIEYLDKVAILDNDNVIFENPIAIHNYDYSGKLYQIKSPNTDLTVTPNHRMWIKLNGKKHYQFMRIDELTTLHLNHQYKNTINKYQPSNGKWIGKKFSLLLEKKLVNLDINDWLRFFSLPFIHGSIDTHNNVISIDTSKTFVKSFLINFLNLLSLSLSSVSSPETNWIIDNKYLVKYFIRDNDDQNKNRNKWMSKLNKIQSKFLIDNIFGNRFLINLKCKYLADYLMNVAFQAGYYSQIIEENNNFTLKIIKEEKSINNDDNLREINLIDHIGSVYCLTVRTGIFYVRENGKPVWTGNSRHGQKGTIGMLYRQEDMPYTKEGIVPDIIMNPLAIPSRMTIGQLIECILGKACAINGYEADATPFTGIDVEQFTSILEKSGFEKYGTQVLYNGRTGEQLNARIFIGPTFYYKLKHIVSDKWHCLTLDHEVLTKTGWKYYPELTQNDEIATLGENDELIYQKPTELIYYPDYNGKMYRVKTSRINLNVTIQHRMYIMDSDNDGNSHSTYLLRNADEIYGKNVRYKNNIKQYGKITSLKSQSRLRGIGAYSSSLNYRFLMMRINSLANKINKSKCYLLPKWVFNINTQMSKILLSKIEIYMFPFEKLVDDLTIICLHAGFAGIKSYNFTLNKWILTIDYENHPAATTDNKLEELIYDYHGPVFCLQVPHQIFYVRKNGLPCWTGNSRSTGPYQLLTRQPAEGRSRDGGLRVGEMERDSLLAHGASHFLKERLFDSSDKFVFYVCKNKDCGMIAIVNPEKSIFRCNYCDNTTSFAKVFVPYATKLMWQELMTMGIAPRMITK